MGGDLMSNKDFQNGFALGLASGGIVESGGGSAADVSFDSNSGIINFDNVLVNQEVINL